MEQNVDRRQQGIRMAAGAMFLSAAILPRRWLALVGLGLLWTATSRYCPVNQTLGIGSEESEGEELGRRSGADSLLETATH